MHAPCFSGRRVRRLSAAEIFAKSSAFTLTAPSGWITISTVTVRPPITVSQLGFGFEKTELFQPSPGPFLNASTIHEPPRQSSSTAPTAERTALPRCAALDAATNARARSAPRTANRTPRTSTPHQGNGAEQPGPEAALDELGAERRPEHVADAADHRVGDGKDRSERRVVGVRDRRRAKRDDDAADRSDRRPNANA